MRRTFTETMKLGITIDKRSKNDAWGIYFHLSVESFYIGLTLAGIDAEFHIHNVRDIVYPSSSSTVKEDKE